MSRDETMVNAFVPGLGNLPPETEALVARRQRLLGPAYRLFYETPVHFVRAQGAWLYDAQGAAYLDCYNNVASLGHAHPRVLEATARQAAIYASHTRYLNDTVLDCAEKLLSHFPPELSQVMFTCTGSEANDLALRICFAATGGTGLVVTENAYHGVTHLMAGASPSLGPGVNLGPHVRTVPAPRDAASFAADVAAAFADLSRHGVKPAALLVDTIFSSDGVIPGAFLGPAVQATHEAGALMIADEVQPGFGRTGAHWWGFQTHGITPDLVTMGKPMGNGYPVAALVAKPEVLLPFGTKARYFNTFGGNAVACATAMAVMEVIETDDLLANASRIGALMAEGLRSLTHEALGETRQAGLFLGLDILEDGHPSAARAARLVNLLREARVLISATGPKGHVLKIRPPLILTEAQADLFLTATKAALRLL
ncbi:aspartate aminotransferase family protein [Stagnihabitans tardus]|uniref:Aminotransferase class III-fold pyridoxal phosphate-dependent enzyme n=1 Tax=Stagnihabitans tardus TaxID=2699202 RepID=A0AAE4YAZ2_9RHOB|nr:aspartate aminotransferase family protein [Stagnihabitans tardus]NBZ88121.1 aminotransferase class III-fold pyridoxal phosphate-dependent enzyme [Stagnihabitans tardus]